MKRVLAVALLILSLNVGASARADDAVAPAAVRPAPSGLLGGLFPSTTICGTVKGTPVCIEPAVTVVSTVNLKTGNIDRDVGFAGGYGVTVNPASPLRWGIDFLGGSQTAGGWNAGALLKLNMYRLGVIYKRQAGVDYAALAYGIGG